MTDFNFLKYEEKNNCAFITLARAEIHNAFNEVLIEEIIRAFTRAENESSVRLVILKGEGKSFCAGADLQWMKKMKDYSSAENYRDSQELCRLFHSINFCSKPVLGVAHGACLGGGVGLVSSCDFVIATEDCQFGLTEARLGLVPAVISPFVIAKIGESNARAYFLSGSRFPAIVAQQMGLVHRVVNSSENLEKVTEEVMGEFLKAGPVAAVKAKELIFNVVKHEKNFTARSIYRFTCELISNLRVSKEGQEGMNSLLEKRAPNWMKK